MEAEPLKYLYQPSVVMEVLILLAVLLSFTKPKYLTALVTALLLLRPNERFDCLVSYPKIAIPVLALSLFLFSDKERRVHQLNYDKPLLYFLFVIVIQTFLFSIGDLGKIAEYLGVSLLLYCAVVLFCTDSKGVRLLNYAVVFSCLIICGEALYYHFTETEGSLIWEIFHLKKSGRLQAWGNWGNSNETAFLACLGIANILYLCTRFKLKIFYVTGIVLLPFFILVIYLTASRAGLASLIIVFLPILFLMNSKFAKVIVLTILISIVVLSSVYTPQRVDSDASTEDRYDLRYRGIQVFKQNPIFGVGFLQARYEIGGQPPHNTYLQALVETGLTGAPFLFYFLYRIGLRIYNSSQTLKLRQLYRTDLAVIAGQFLSSLFYFLWGNQLLSLLFFIIIAQVNIGLGLVEEDSLGTNAFDHN